LTPGAARSRAARSGAATPGAVTVLGVRHHGPGSALAVEAALARLRPDAVLVEGPPEADPLLPLAADPAMRPPVALLAHAADDPSRAAFWPFAEFSPEWVALRWALRAGAEAGFADLPVAHTLAGAGAGAGAGARVARGTPADRDPIAELARAAGAEPGEEPDADAWWDDVVEHAGTAGDPLEHFAALAEAMTELRAGEFDGQKGDMHTGDAGPGVDALREAAMRRRIRAARRAGRERIAVVCGAWHAPALTREVSAAADDALLRGLPRVRVAVTWVPWTDRRLARRSGYGAGIASPGWYGHVFRAGRAEAGGAEEAGSDVPARWMARVAALLRAEDHAVSSADVIEAVRLATALAALRGRPVVGLAEATDAARAVLCEGSDVPLALVHDRLVVGEGIGRVPAGAPAVPLQRAIEREARSLRLKPEGTPRLLDLDLREPAGAARSRLLHRLRLIDVDWGTPTASRTAATGTFRESWRLSWEPELEVRIAEAGVWGTTVPEAARTRVAELAEAGAVAPGGLAELTALSERCLLAGLPEALPPVLRALGDRAALDTDVLRLAEALPALVRTARYGDVRGTDAGALRSLAEGLALRVCVGLSGACAGLDVESAAELRARMDAVDEAVALLDAARGTPGPGCGPGSRPGPASGPGPGRRWEAALRAVARRADAPGLLRGRAVRLLLERGRLTAEQVARIISAALSPGAGAPDAAGWIEGFLGGSGTLLVHDPRLLPLVDEWLTRVPEPAFTAALPLLRRTFAGFEAGVRRAVAERVAAGGEPGPADRPDSNGTSATAVGPDGFATAVDHGRADAVEQVLALLLGEGPGNAREDDCEDDRGEDTDEEAAG